MAHFDDRAKSFWRRRFARHAFAYVVFGLCLVGAARAWALDVPPRAQARLLVKVAEYERNLVRREGPRVILLVRKAADAESASIAEEMAAELKLAEAVAGGPHSEVIVDFSSARALLAEVKSHEAAIVYLSSGLQEHIAGIASALDGVSVLTAGCGPGDAERGAVLGFDMVSGRIQLVVNLPRARSQNAAFRPEFLRLARVIR